MSIKSMFNAFIKKTFLRDDGTVSTTKVGLAIAGASTAILTLPASVTAIAATAGITGVSIVLPAVVVSTAKVAGLIGGWIAGLGARDALDKSKSDIQK